jgi:hypothetical protein
MHQSRLFGSMPGGAFGKGQPHEGFKAKAIHLEFIARFAVGRFLRIIGNVDRSINPDRYFRPQVLNTRLGGMGKAFPGPSEIT